MATLSGCPRPEELERFLLGYGDASSVESIEGHFASCAHCTELAGGFASDDEFDRAIRTAGQADETAELENLNSLVRVLQRAVAESRLQATIGFEGTLEKPIEPQATRTEKEAEVSAIGRYEIRGQLGAGGMGVVYRAHDPALDREVALKVVRRQLIASTDAVENFLAEARAVAAVEHDNIVAIHGVEVHDGVPCIVMPMLMGQSLAGFLEKNPPPVPLDRLMRLAVETLSGLSAAHSRGFVHRDIKPGNLWLEGAGDGKFGRVKILDFGLATSVGSDRVRFGGTPGFMPPEQIRNEVLDGRADLFSVGCVLYIAATGQSPFAGGNVSAVLVRTISHEVPPLGTVNPKLPARFASLVDRMLTKYPEGRPESADAALAELAEIEAEAEVRRRKLSRRRWLAGVGAATVAGGLGAWAFARPAAEAPPVAVEIEHDPDVTAAIASRDGQERVLRFPADNALSLVPGEYMLRLPNEVTGRKLEPSSFVVLPGEPRTLKISLVGEVAKSSAHDGPVTGVAAFAEKGELAVLSASLDRTLSAWTPGAKREPTLARASSPVRAFSASGDGRVLVTAGWNKQPPLELGVQRWNGRTLAVDGPPLDGHSRAISALAVSADGKQVLSASAGEVWLRSVPGQRREELVGHGEAKVVSAAFDATGKRALTGDDAGYLILWDTATARVLRKVVAQSVGDAGAVRAVAFAPKGFLSAGDDGIVRIWDPATFESRELSKRSKSVGCLAVTADGNRFLCGDAEGNAVLGSTVDGAILAILAGHRGPVNAIAFAPDGRNAVSGGADRTVRIWRLPLP